MQVIVFSPPESWLIETGCLPGGRAMISMPASSGSILLHDRLDDVVWPSSPLRSVRPSSSSSVSRIDVRLAAAEELAEHALEMLADGVEGLLEAQAAFGVDLVDQLFELLLAGRSDR